MWAADYDIIVETLTGSEFEVTVNETDTVAYLKYRIKKYEGIPVGQQHILYQHKELKDAMEMRDIPVSKGSRLTLVLGLRGGPISARRVVSDCEKWYDLSDVLNSTSARRHEPLTISTTGVKVLLYKDCKKNLHRLMKLRAGKNSSSHWSIGNQQNHRTHNNHKSNSDIITSTKGSNGTSSSAGTATSHWSSFSFSSEKVGTPKETRAKSSNAKTNDCMASFPSYDMSNICTGDSISVEAHDQQWLQENITTLEKMQQLRLKLDTKKRIKKENTVDSLTKIEDDSQQDNNVHKWCDRVTTNTTSTTTITGTDHINLENKIYGGVKKKASALPTLPRLRAPYPCDDHWYPKEVNRNGSEDQLWNAFFSQVKNSLHGKHKKIVSQSSSTYIPSINKINNWLLPKMVTPTEHDQHQTKIKSLIGYHNNGYDNKGFSDNQKRDIMKDFKLLMIDSEPEKNGFSSRKEEPLQVKRGDDSSSRPQIEERLLTQFYDNSSTQCENLFQALATKPATTTTLTHGSISKPAAVVPCIQDGDPNNKWSFFAAHSIAADVALKQTAEAATKNSIINMQNTNLVSDQEDEIDNYFLSSLLLKRKSLFKHQPKFAKHSSNYSDEPTELKKLTILNSLDCISNNIENEKKQGVDLSGDRKLIRTIKQEHRNCSVENDDAIIYDMDNGTDQLAMANRNDMEVIKWFKNRPHQSFKMNNESISNDFPRCYNNNAYASADNENVVTVEVESYEDDDDDCDEIEFEEDDDEDEDDDDGFVFDDFSLFTSTSESPTTTLSAPLTRSNVIRNGSFWSPEMERNYLSRPAQNQSFRYFSLPMRTFDEFRDDGPDADSSDDGDEIEDVITDVADDETEDDLNKILDSVLSSNGRNTGDMGERDLMSPTLTDINLLETDLKMMGLDVILNDDDNFERSFEKHLLGREDSKGFGKWNENEEVDEKMKREHKHEAVSKVDTNTNIKNCNLKRKKSQKLRCAQCNKKLGLVMIMKCHCGKVFCAEHRYAEMHNCTYNFKEEGKRILTHENPLVVAEKLPKF